MMAGVFTKNVFRILTVYVGGLILGATTKAMVMVMAMSPISKMKNNILGTIPKTL